ncbi:MAG: rod shape-determining protein MreD [Acidobacteriota bacterium]|nr:rod shape-determining protein MreD [Acidobacteriota bacterium]
MANVTYTSREQIEVHRFSLWATIGVPLAALLLQSLLGTRLRLLSVFDLPLLVTIFFAVARRNQLTGMATGMFIGLLQDSLTHHPIGMYGISKTVVGFAASSLGVRFDVENPGSRIIMGFGFYLVHQAIYFAVARNLVSEDIPWAWGHTLGAALANGLLAVVLFAMLDKLKRRG